MGLGVCCFYVGLVLLNLDLTHNQSSVQVNEHEQMMSFKERERKVYDCFHLTQYWG